MTADDYTENQKKLIEIKYPDKYKELWGETKKE
jgi:hypothetical protein